MSNVNHLQDEVKCLQSGMMAINLTPPTSPCRPSSSPTCIEPISTNVDMITDRGHGHNLNKALPKISSTENNSARKAVSISTSYGYSSPNIINRNISPCALPLVRNHSSPSVIDSSPKSSYYNLKAAATPSPMSIFRGIPPTSGGGVMKSELTPVTRNTTTEDYVGDDLVQQQHQLPLISKNMNLASISVPETKSLPRHGHIDPSGAAAGSYTGNKARTMTIQPRYSINVSSNTKLNDTSRHVTPPSSFHHQSSPKSLQSPQQKEQESQKERYVSPPPPPTIKLTRPLPLDRNCFSFTGTIEYENQEEDEEVTTEESLRKFRTVPPPRTTINESEDGVLLHQVRENFDNSNDNILQYQPSRDSSLDSFVGVVPDEASNIFLAPRRLRRKQGEDSDDGCTELEQEPIGEDNGRQEWVVEDLSFPSIRLARHLTGSTTTFEDSGSFVDCFDEDGFVLLDPEEEDFDGASQKQQQVLYHHVQQQLSAIHLVSPSPPRCTSQQKAQGRQQRSDKALEWLKTVDVGKNNQYVAEAASSKFLTGKRNRPTIAHTSNTGSSVVMGRNSNTGSSVVMGRNVSMFRAPALGRRKESRRITVGSVSRLKPSAVFWPSESR